MTALTPTASRATSGMSKYPGKTHVEPVPSLGGWGAGVGARARRYMRVMALVALPVFVTAAFVYATLVVSKWELLGGRVVVPGRGVDVGVDGRGDGRSGGKRLLFYNRPPKTGSTSVRVAMKEALDAGGMVSAKCFNMIEWNEMALRTIVHRRNVDFYGCHTRLTRERFVEVSALRGGNVVFMTSTRPADDIVLSAYLQKNRARNILAITGAANIREETEQFRKFVTAYPVDALYNYHGADEPLKTCPTEWRHEAAMQRVASRYEIVVDLSRPRESAAMVHAATGLEVDFDVKMNERTGDEGPMLRALRNVNTTAPNCGNELVHRVLMQQFHVVKDRLMQNRCFDEGTGTYELCDGVELSAEGILERSRNESFVERKRLEGLRAGKSRA